MNDAQRSATPTVLLALVLFGVLGTGAAGVAAQEPAPDHPSDEPRMLDIADTENLQVAARDAVRQGRISLNNAHRYLAKASEAEGTKREKLESKAEKAYESAVQSFMAALRYDQDLPEAYMGLGNAWLETGQADKALQAWGAARQRAPEDPEALFGLGRCLVELDRPRDAASVYLNLANSDAERATELLGMLETWGEPRAAEGDEEAQQLLDWIEQQRQG